MAKFVSVDSQSSPGEYFAVLQEVIESAGLEYRKYQAKTDEEVIEAAKDADAIGVTYAQINENVISHLKKCKVIMRHGIGYDNVDIPAATRAGIVVCNTPDYCSTEVSTHALALILDCVRKTTFFDRSMRKGEWDTTLGYQVRRISAHTLGLIAFGKISRQLAAYAKGMGMRVIAYDAYLPKEKFAECGVESVSLDELFAQSDIISVHCPLTPETTHIIDRKAIEKMKDGVIIVNTARGPSVCLEDLLDGLESGKVKAAGLDVVEGEPILDMNHRMFCQPNLVLTPHSAFNSHEAVTEQFQIVGKTAIAVLAGERPYNILNKDVFK